MKCPFLSHTNTMPHTRNTRRHIMARIHSIYQFAQTYKYTKHTHTFNNWQNIFVAHLIRIWRTITSRVYHPLVWLLLSLLFLPSFCPSALLLHCLLIQSRCYYCHRFHHRFQLYCICFCIFSVIFLVQLMNLAQEPTTHLVPLEIRGRKVANSIGFELWALSHSIDLS